MDPGISLPAGILWTCRNSHDKFPLNSLESASKHFHSSYITLHMCWTITWTWFVLGSGLGQRAAGSCPSSHKKRWRMWIYCRNPAQYFQLLQFFQSFSFQLQMFFCCSFHPVSRFKSIYFPSIPALPILLLSLLTKG